MLLIKVDFWLFQNDDDFNMKSEQKKSFKEFTRKFNKNSMKKERVMKMESQIENLYKKIIQFLLICTFLRFYLRRILIMNENNYFIIVTGEYHHEHSIHSIQFTFDYIIINT